MMDTLTSLYLLLFFLHFAKKFNNSLLAKNRQNNVLFIHLFFAPELVNSLHLIPVLCDIITPIKYSLI